MATMPEYEQLKQMVADAEEDVSKAVGGNKAAGTRARQKMSEIRTTAMDVRKKVLEIRGGGGSDAGGAAADSAPAARI